MVHHTWESYFRLQSIKPVFLLTEPMFWDSVCLRVIEHTSESESDELEDDDDEESLELSDAMPVDSCRSTLSASAARSGRSCFKILKQQIQTDFV